MPKMTSHAAIDEIRKKTKKFGICEDLIMLDIIISTKVWKFVHLTDNQKLHLTNVLVITLLNI